jgi:hypothetical protein
VATGYETVALWPVVQQLSMCKVEMALKKINSEIGQLSGFNFVALYLFLQLSQLSF